MNKVSKVMITLLLLLVTTFALVGCGCDNVDKRLTASNYNEIVVGTSTYDDVIDILGKPTGDTKLDNGDGTLIWKNSRDTKSITLTFNNNVVSNKMQTGIIDETNT